jgi:protein-S-isoprenylcysteine O-methyltransferase Ste14
MNESMRRIGDVLFRWRNVLGPLVFVAALVIGRPAYPFGRPDLNVAFDVAGVLIALAGQALRILTIGYDYIERGGRDRKVYASSLVQGGVFGHSRNPLYVGNILIAVGLALIVHSWVFYLVALPFVFFAYACIVAAEEAFLRKRFGAEYEAYCARVNRWWPHWAGFSHSVRDMEFSWSRVLVKEYNTLFVLVFSLSVIRLWSEYRVVGDAALPSAELLLAGFGIWLGLYLLVRSLKKSGVVRA